MMCAGRIGEEKEKLDPGQRRRGTGTGLRCFGSGPTSKDCSARNARNAKDCSGFGDAESKRGRGASVAEPQRDSQLRDPSTFFLSVVDIGQVGGPTSSAIARAATICSPHRSPFVRPSLDSDWLGYGGKQPVFLYPQGVARIPGYMFVDDFETGKSSNEGLRWRLPPPQAPGALLARQRRRGLRAVPGRGGATSGAATAPAR